MATMAIPILPEFCLLDLSNLMVRKKNPRKGPKLPASPPKECNGCPAVANQPPPPRKGQPVTLEDPVPLRTACADVACGTAASCAAVCCCCPGVLVSLCVLATVQLPVGLCRLALRAKKKRREAAKKQKAVDLLGQNVAPAAYAEAAAEGGVAAVDQMENFNRKAVDVGARGGLQEPNERLWESQLEEIEKEMSAWTGFWRSPSQREEER